MTNIDTKKKNRTRIRPPVAVRRFDFTRKGEPWPVLEIVQYCCCIAGVPTVAARLGVTERTVWRWFNAWPEDTVKVRGEKRIRRLLNALGIDASGAHFFTEAKAVLR